MAKTRRLVLAEVDSGQTWNTPGVKIIGVYPESKLREVRQLARNLAAKYAANLSHIREERLRDSNGEYIEFWWMSTHKVRIYFTDN